MEKEPNMELKLSHVRLKRLLGVISTLTIFNIVYPQCNDCNVIIGNTLFERNFKLSNELLHKLDTNSKQILIEKYFSYLNLGTKTTQLDLEANELNRKFYDTVFFTNIIDESSNWRLKNEIILHFIYSVYLNNISDYKDSYLYTKGTYFTLSNNNDKLIFYNKRLYTKALKSYLKWKSVMCNKGLKYLCDNKISPLIFVNGIVWKSKGTFPNHPRL